MSKEIKEEEAAIDFDLPEAPEGTAKAKPRIHQAAGDSSVCVSCEG